MPSNIEIKASIRDIEQLRQTASQLSKSEGELIIQEDTFFNAPNGRLKLRQLQGSLAQLIYYSRPDQEGPKLSDYHITLVENAADLKETLRLALGVRGEVKKKRHLYLVGQTRVHVDQVEGLGDFMELEVVMREGQELAEGQKIADDLMTQLGISPDDLIKGAYLDLILSRQKE